MYTLLCLSVFILAIKASGDCSGTHKTTKTNYKTCWDDGGRCCKKNLHGDKKLKANLANSQATVPCDCYKTWIAYVAPTYKICSSQQNGGRKIGKKQHAHGCKDRGGSCCKPSANVDAFKVGAGARGLGRLCGECWSGKPVDPAHSEYVDILQEFNADKEIQDRLFYYEALENYNVEKEIAAESELQLDLAREKVETDRMVKELKKRRARKHHRESIW
eukprot:220198_1